jgi:hypothetical protein
MVSRDNDAIIFGPYKKKKTNVGKISIFTLGLNKGVNCLK